MIFPDTIAMRFSTSYPLGTLIASRWTAATYDQTRDTNTKARFHSIHSISSYKKRLPGLDPISNFMQVIEADTLRLEFVIRFSN